MAGNEETILEMKIGVAKIQAELGETNRRLDRIEKTLDGQNLFLSTFTALQAKVDNNEKRITGLEKSREYALKLVVGAVITAIMGVIVLKPSIALGMALLY